MDGYRYRAVLEFRFPVKVFRTRVKRCTRSLTGKGKGVQFEERGILIAPSGYMMVVLPSRLNGSLFRKDQKPEFVIPAPLQAAQNATYDPNRATRLGLLGTVVPLGFRTFAPYPQSTDLKVHQNEQWTRTAPFRGPERVDKDLALVKRPWDVPLLYQLGPDSVAPRKPSALKR